ncbi:glycoside hydrolase family 26 protein [Flammeovirga yaeyamensis]|uniref:Mannan endo-1,4-beta-mannosidase n=1 Tax=Flammeovirga yaeyamensis TaxID=367791 RepID=A0AAX1NBQ7_9BACT|nr:glycosyl hydrolase [Flammeovirga yaeyamensis]MBB3697062.1 mannan endo-1,4-beta-mannosidase [Flammeovirga yaeyamensis]NMF33724.1 beta-mannosidase [Flammeovirga yaeyamensis]QWG05010.1 glycoside hydrolase family 26 protein [Flammeovirga yaeyamensis]
MRKRLVAASFLIGLLTLNFGTAEDKAKTPKLNDKKATKETVALYEQLHQVSESGKTIFGHQDDLAYGYHWWGNGSDVKNVTGDYPGLYGWDMGHIGEEKNLDGVPFEDIKRYIKESYSRGGITTLSWHMINLKENSSSWDTTRVLHEMMKGGKYRQDFINKLDLFAEFVDDLELEGKKIPVLFRPWHEHNGSWFWWGGKNVEIKDYKKLWQFTVEYLRDEKGIHNIIYVYSTDAFDSEESYLERYPGDKYVDVLGFDDYGAYRANATPEREQWVIRELETVAKLAQQKNKICAFTESGLEAVTDDQFFTTKLLDKLNHNEWTKKAAYVMLWRNANYQKEQRDHFYVPYKGHSSAKDFIKFKEDPSILFESDLMNMKVN